MSDASLLPWVSQRPSRLRATAVFCGCALSALAGAILVAGAAGWSSPPALAGVGLLAMAGLAGIVARLPAVHGGAQIRIDRDGNLLLRTVAGGDIGARVTFLSDWMVHLRTDSGIALTLWRDAVAPDAFRRIAAIARWRRDSPAQPGPNLPAAHRA